MTVAVVHDYLIERGRSERLVLQLAGALERPVVLAAVYCPESSYPELEELDVVAGRVVGAGAAARLSRRGARQAEVLRSFDLSGFDRALVVSSGIAHHARHPHSAVYWDIPPAPPYDPASGIGGGEPAIRPSLAGSRRWRRRDVAAATAHRLHAAPSEAAAARLRMLYGIEATVLAPLDPVDSVDSVGGTTTFAERVTAWSAGSEGSPPTLGATAQATGSGAGFARSRPRAVAGTWAG
ncbi:MAG TPA: hypothetical protein VHB02_12795 [Acidimicrobiales bacterium]|nr:hypothetical protein [Acidimicrobiales bacterium]